MTKVIAYIRVSSTGQIEGNGLERQRTTIQSYCDTNNLDLIDIIEDAGISGTQYERNGLTQVYNHEIKTIIIEKLDRLGRDLMVSEKIIHTLQSKGHNLISVKEGKDLLDNQPSRKLIRQMMGSIAEYEKSTIVERLRIAREQVKKDTGRCEGQKSLLEVKPDTYKEMKRLRRMRKGYKRRTYKEISCILNSTGYTSKRGLPFTPVNVARILS